MDRGFKMLERQKQLDPKDWQSIKDRFQGRIEDIGERNLSCIISHIPDSYFEERAKKALGKEFVYDYKQDLEDLETVLRALNNQFDELYCILSRKEGLATHNEGIYLVKNIDRLIQLLSSKCRGNDFIERDSLFYTIKNNIIGNFEREFQDIYEVLKEKHRWTKWDKLLLLRSFMLRAKQPIDDLRNWKPTLDFCAIYELYLEHYEKNYSKKNESPPCFGFFDENDKNCCSYALGGECKKEWESKDPYKFYIDADVKLLKVFLIIADNKKKYLPVIGKIDITPNLTDEERFNCPQSENKWAIEFIEKRYRFFEEQGLIIMEDRIHLTRQQLGWNEVK
jgi:hypothetical protein